MTKQITSRVQARMFRRAIAILAGVKPMYTRIVMAEMDMMKAGNSFRIVLFILVGMAYNKDM